MGSSSSRSVPSEDLWNIFCQPYFMTDIEIRVKFYVAESEGSQRYIGIGLKNRLDGTYSVMLVDNEKKQLPLDYGISKKALYNHLYQELRRSSKTMEDHPDRFLVNGP